MSTNAKITWSKKHDRCLKCGTQECPHKAKGYCSRCYNYETENKQQLHIIRKSRKLEKGIDIQDIQFSYQTLNMSLNDIARKYNCTRQYIHKLMKNHGIIRRDKSKARELAQILRKGCFQSRR